MLIAREVDYGVMLLKALVRTLFLTLGFALERLTGIEPALSAWKLSGAAALSPADWLTCGSADTLTVRNRDCPRRLLLTGM
jgi:hypothetical protein